MNSEFEYYYNDVPNKGLCRNNLIYTSLISKDKKTFCQWYYNDEGYHGGHNEVVDPTLMKEKFLREVNCLTYMRNHYPEHVPNITKIDLENQKIYFDIEGVDFWEQAGCLEENYSKVLPDWQEQMLEIIQAHKNIGLYKYSMHPSSYFIVDGKLKSINYFFAYRDGEPGQSIQNAISHISIDRRKELIPKMKSIGLELDTIADLNVLQHLCFNSFITNYPQEFIEKAKAIYK